MVFYIKFPHRNQLNADQYDHMETVDPQIIWIFIQQPWLHRIHFERRQRSCQEQQNTDGVTGKIGQRFFVQFRKIQKLTFGNRSVRMLIFSKPKNFETNRDAEVCRDAGQRDDDQWVVDLHLWVDQGPMLPNFLRT